MAEIFMGAMRHVLPSKIVALYYTSKATPFRRANDINVTTTHKYLA
jgi:hypothetical protein